MSDPTALAERTVKPQRHLTPDEQAAIIAAVATGRPQVQVAKDFGVHRNTVYAIVKGVKALEHPANPLANGYKPVIERESASAILRGLQCTDNPYDAAKIGVECMKGLGVFANGSHVQVDTDIAINISWGSAQEPEQTVIDTTASPLESTPRT